MAFDFSGFKNNFFDSASVLNKLGSAKRKALSRQGAFVRRRAKSSIRYRLTTSEPGSPPSAHRSGRFTRTKKNKKTGVEKKQASSPLRELIYFAYDASRDNVVVGPELFRNSVAGGGLVPKALEKGGTVDVGKLAFHKQRRRTIYLRPRPFMGPAELAERPKFAAQFKGMIH